VHSSGFAWAKGAARASFASWKKLTARSFFTRILPNFCGVRVIFKPYQMGPKRHLARESKAQLTPSVSLSHQKRAFLEWTAWYGVWRPKGSECVNKDCSNYRWHSSSESECSESTSNSYTSSEGLLIYDFWPSLYCLNYS
jgi:hypothetical protein